MRLCGISSRFQLLSPCMRQVTHALLTRPPLSHSSIRRNRSASFDLHVLSTPPAFILSQDQTLMLKCLCPKLEWQLACYLSRLLLGFCSWKSLIKNFRDCDIIQLSKFFCVCHSFNRLSHLKVCVNTFFDFLLLNVSVLRQPVYNIIMILKCQHAFSYK